ncbi:hypothetical protein ACP8HI_01090 [Paenibacillus sp. FA6]|uniref:hypothetical protein n=1 Tax=Paenibacillus sp. FA6 TaxID=3413029 RepID=UPI003F65683E
MEKVIPNQQSRLPMLSLWSDNDFSGRRLRFRGNLGVRSLEVFNFNDALSSFRFEGRNQSTLVLFEDINYQGSRRVFRGSDVERDSLGNFNDRTSSFIISRNRLSNSDINRIQNRGTAPSNFAEVLSDGTTSVRKGIVRKTAVKK